MICPSLNEHGKDINYYPKAILLETAHQLSNLSISEVSINIYVFFILSK